MIRQSLDADSAYVDVALHGDGLTSLQFRDAKGAATHEVQANVSAPGGSASRSGAVRPHVPGGRGRGAELLGRGRADRVRGAVLRRHRRLCAQQGRDRDGGVLERRADRAAARPPRDSRSLYSTLETQTIASTDRRVVHVTPARIEAPNWLRDGKTLIYNSGGRIFRIPAAGGEPEAIDTGFATRCNNDHGVSPDGTLLAISDQSQGRAEVAHLHAPDHGRDAEAGHADGPVVLARLVARRQDPGLLRRARGEFDIYTIPADGGPETRLTTAKGLDDGPEYSPDGKFIYFNSVRTGTMQIWRMRPDGSGQEQVTSDEFNNWFPHPRPTAGRWSSSPTRRTSTGHPENKDVTLRHDDARRPGRSTCWAGSSAARGRSTSRAGRPTAGRSRS